MLAIFLNRFIYSLIYLQIKDKDRQLIKDKFTVSNNNTS